MNRIVFIIPVIAFIALVGFFGIGLTKDPKVLPSQLIDRPPPAFDLPAQGVRVAFIDVANSQLELIEPLGEASPIHGFLKKNPAGGQHHVCFEVADIVAARDAMRARGATVLGTGEPRIGAHGVPIIFVHPKDAGGVLVELMATPAGHH